MNENNYLDTTFICSWCLKEKEETPNLLDDEFICEYCLEKMTFCSLCGVFEECLKELDNGKLVCEDCFNEQK